MFRENSIIPHMFKWMFGKKEDDKRDKAKGEEKVYRIDESFSPQALSKWAYSLLKELSSFGPRPSLSEESGKFASIIESSFSSLGIDSKVVEFTGNRRAGETWTRAFPFLLTASFVFSFFGLPYIALILSAGMFFLWYYDVIKGTLRLFEKRGQGSNVIATIEPKGEKKRCVMISSHLDSARIMQKDNGQKMSLFNLVSLLYLFVLSLFLILHESLSSVLFLPNRPSVITSILLIFGLALSVYSFRVLSVYSDKYSPGIGDNISGIAVMLAVAKYFEKNRPEETALVFASFDGEEIGEQGARAYFEKLDDKDNLLLINIDSIYFDDELYLLKRDGFGFVPLDNMLISSLSALSSDLGYRVKTIDPGLLFGSSDASVAAKMQIPAVTITSVVPSSENPSHTEEDTADSVSQLALEKVISLLVKFIERSDRKEGEKMSGFDRKYTFKPL